MPMVMAGVTLLVCILGWTDARALWIGIPAGLVGWGIAALVAQHFATVERANPDVYQELRCRFAILQTQRCTIQKSSPNPAQPPCENPYHSLRRATAMAEIKTYLDEVGNELDPEKEQHLDSLRRKDSLRETETTKPSVSRARNV